MTETLVDCRKCGVHPQEGLIELSGDSDITFIDSTVRCLTCGSKATVLDGNYRSSSIPDFGILYTPTPAARRRLATVAEWASSEMEKPAPDTERVEKRLEDVLEKEAPDFLSKARDWWNSPGNGHAASWAAVLLALVIAIVK